MKIDFINNDEYIIYLNKYYYTFDKENIDSCLKSILKKLKKMYDIEIYSTFNIGCHINKYYGIILDIKREYDPFNLYSKKTNLNIKFFDDSVFLYEVDDYFLKDKINCSVYLYKNKIYLNVNDDIFSIIEHVSNIIFGNNVSKIVSVS